MYASNEERLEVVVGRLLRQRKLTLATAESCTGGLIGHRITDVPGSSDYYLGTLVAYAAQIKQRLLQVKPQTLRRYGQVSAETAREMAQGVRRVFHASLGVSVTGIAGPGGGSLDKPVGLVYVGLADAQGSWVEQHTWDGDRRRNKSLSAEAALDLIRRYVGDEL